MFYFAVRWKVLRWLEPLSWQRSESWQRGQQMKMRCRVVLPTDDDHCGWILRPFSLFLFHGFNTHTRRVRELWASFTFSFWFHWIWYKSHRGDLWPSSPPGGTCDTNQRMVTPWPTEIDIRPICFALESERSAAEANASWWLSSAVVMEGTANDTVVVMQTNERLTWRARCIFAGCGGQKVSLYFVSSSHLFLFETFAEENIEICCHQVHRCGRVFVSFVLNVDLGPITFVCSFSGPLLIAN